MKPVVSPYLARGGHFSKNPPRSTETPKREERKIGRKEVCGGLPNGARFSHEVVGVVGVVRDPAREIAHVSGFGVSGPVDRGS